VGFFWAFQCVPTQDGPAHLALAVVFKSLLAGDCPYRGYYELNLTLAPYWTYHAVMVPLLSAFRPLAAEKIFLSWYLIAFAAAAWYFTKAAAGKASALGLLFFAVATSYPFQMGFYNFVAGLPVFLLTASFFWAGRERAGGRYWVVLNLLLAACYFSHLIAALAGIVSIWGMALWSAFAARRPERFTRAVLYLAPSYVLPAYYFLTWPVGEYYYRPLGLLVRGFISADTFVSFGPEQRPVALAVASLYVLLLVAAAVSRVRRRELRPRPSDSFAALAALFVVVYLVAPHATTQGSYFSERMALFPILFITPWLAANLPRRLARPAAVAAVVLALGNLVPLGRYYARENAKLKDFNSGCCAVARGATMLPLIRDPTHFGRRVESLRHAVGYYVVAGGGCNLVDICAGGDHFPIKHAPGVVPPRCLGSSCNLRVYDLEAARPAPDYVVAYDINPFLPEVRAVFEKYRPVHFKGKLIVYERAAGRAGEGVTPMGVE
jgi:hypothetical protein